MRITPLDIQHKVFPKQWRGYDTLQVNEFLDLLANTVEGLVKENGSLREKLLAREDELGQLRKAEATLTNTLISTQNFSDQLKHNAQQEAERIVKEGELRAEQVVLQARAELAELHHSLADLRRQRIVALERIRATIRAFDRILELEENEQPAASPYDKEISLPPEETSYSPHG